MMCVHLNRVVRTSSFVAFFVCVCVHVVAAFTKSSVCVADHSQQGEVIGQGYTRPILLSQNPHLLLTAFANYYRIKEELVEALLYLSKTSNFGFMTQEKAQIYLSCLYFQSLRIAVTWKPVESWRIRLLIHPLALYSSCQNNRRGHGLTFPLDELIILISRPLNLYVNQALRVFLKKLALYKS